MDCSKPCGEPRASGKSVRQIENGSSRAGVSQPFFPPRSSNHGHEQGYSTLFQGTLRFGVPLGP